ncbi:hypothetical protein MG293_002473 [Ovis ammon polii]|uniref:Uncharacterized protein n=1 Tax=Ovis ammon polii TaxID=230172 RepID=A0AAD4UGQ9_OVIAM|nr:hypothetical protein MG293_002473 [Ovis ammon polii]
MQPTCSFGEELQVESSVLVRVPCWHRQRMLPCIPKFKAVSCCGGDSLVPRNADFRFTGSMPAPPPRQLGWGAQSSPKPPLSPVSIGTWVLGRKTSRSSSWRPLAASAPASGPPSFGLQQHLKSGHQWNRVTHGWEAPVAF